MKKRLTTVFLAAFAMLAGMSLSASAELTQVGGVYQIGSAEDLVAFAQFVNGRTTEENKADPLSAELTGPIDMTGVEQIPIGKSGNIFFGSFDGHMYPISNVNNMLFGCTRGSTIKNVAIVSGDITASATTYITQFGTIIGYAAYESGYPTTLSNSYSLANITCTIAKSSDTGGLVGKLYGTIENCFFGGSVTAKGGSAGGIVGSSYGNYTANMSNCFSVASSVTGGNRQGALFGWLHKTGVMNNCYAISDVGTAPNAYTAAGASVTNCGSLTAEQFASGEACFVLNGGETENPTFRQTLGTDSHPVLDNSHSIVYQTTPQTCDGTPKGEAAYSNTNSSTRDAHTFGANGICTTCEKYGVVPEKDGSGVYQIANAGNLLEFARIVSDGEADAKAVVTAAIDLTGALQQPIGTTIAPFTGEFDGQLKPITGVSTMLFGTIDGATISGVALAGGNIEMSPVPYATHLGSIVGTDLNESSVLQNSYSLVSITNTLNTADTGGLVGKILGTLKNSFFAGSVTVCGSSAGALVGSTTSASVASNIQNCFSYATSVTGGNRQGALVGWLHAISVVDNCYAVADVGTFPNGYTTAGAPVSNCEQLTAEQFASGEAAYKLGEAFFQTIGTDAYPAFSGEKVYKTNNVGWATFYDAATNYAFVGVKAYTGKVNGESLTLTEVSQANAGTPVILEGTYYNKVVKATPAEMPANDLVAATTDLAADGSQYVLAVKDDVVGFYQAVDGTIAAGKAYLTGISAGVKAITFGTTSLTPALSEEREAAVIYDMSGRRVEKATKGLYIVNGKKVLK